MKPSTSGSSLLSPTRWPAEAFSARANVVFIAIVAAAVIGGMIVASGAGVAIVALTHRRFTPGSPEFRWFAVIAQALLYIPIAAAMFRFLPHTARRTARELGLRAPTLRDLGAGLLGAIVMYLAVAASAYAQFAALHVKAEQGAVKLLASGHDLAFWIAFGILAVVLAPIVEETAFRGFVFNAFLRYTPAWVAAAASGILFGLSHGEPTAAFPLACGGIVLAIVYYRTGSLAASMTTHATFNFVNVIAVIATGGSPT